MYLQEPKSKKPLIVVIITLLLSLFGGKLGLDKYVEVREIDACSETAAVIFERLSGERPDSKHFQKPCVEILKRLE